MTIMFNEPFQKNGLSIEQLVIEGNRIDIIEAWDKLDRASLNIYECTFDIPYEEEALQNSEKYFEPSGMMFQNLKHLIALFWFIQRKKESREDSNDYEDDFSDELKEVNKLVKTINMYLKHYDVEAKIHQNCWEFVSSDGKSCNFESVIREVYQEELYPYRKISFREKYMAQLEKIFHKYGNNAFQHIEEIQAQTGYEQQKIKSDLKQIRSDIEAAQKQQQTSQFLSSVAQIKSHEDYISLLETLYSQYGNRAFEYDYLKPIQVQTGYERSKVRADLKKIRYQYYISQPQSKPRQPSPSVTQKSPKSTPKPPSKPKLSIEEQLLNYLKTQPVKWEYPIKNQDAALNKFCTALVMNENVAAVSNDTALKNLEMTIRGKRAKNPQLAAYNAAMEGNILAMLYEYSYLMHVFHAMNAIKLDITKVDIQKLWTLIQKDCISRIGNLAEEKRKNPSIQAVLDKYNYDNQIAKLKVLNDATAREMDYITINIMDYYLLVVISLLQSNPQLLQALKPYSANDIAGMMDGVIASVAALRFSAYSNSGGLPKKRGI